MVRNLIPMAIPSDPHAMSRTYTRCGGKGSEMTRGRRPKKYYYNYLTFEVITDTMKRIKWGGTDISFFYSTHCWKGHREGGNAR